MSWKNLKYWRLNLKIILLQYKTNLSLRDHWHHLSHYYGTLIVFLVTCDSALALSLSLKSIGYLEKKESQRNVNLLVLFNQLIRFSINLGQEIILTTVKSNVY